MKYTTALYLVALAFFSYFTILHHYAAISYYTWDEPYYLSSAKKYEFHVAQMSSHPPLAQLLIYAGEAMLAKNRELPTYYMATVSRTLGTPDGFSFEGMRFFPTLFAFLCPFLLFIIFSLVLTNKLHAFLLSLTLVFDNAFVTHSRAAMLDPIQWFFVLAAILVFIWPITAGVRQRWWHYALLSAMITLGVLTKVNAAIMGVLLISYFLYDVFIFQKRSVKKKSHRTAIAREFIAKAGVSLVTFLILFFVVYYIHFSLGYKQPAETQREFFSPEYLAIIDQGRIQQLSSFPVMLRDDIHYKALFQQSTPPKQQAWIGGEYGSPPRGWVVGMQPIRFRENTQENYVQKHYFYPNMVVWFLVLSGLIASLVWLYRKKGNLFSKNRYIMITLLSLYALYMAIMMMTPRVLYLHHYVIPLLAAIVLSGVMIADYLEQYRHHDQRVSIALVIIVILMCIHFAVYAPLTYFLPISYEHYRLLSWFTPWGLQ